MKLGHIPKALNTITSVYKALEHYNNWKEFPLDFDLKEALDNLDILRLELIRSNMNKVIKNTED